MIVFPAVDIQDGRCVRLLQGQPDTAQTYYEMPWQAGLHWQEEGAQTLHVVDLDGALRDRTDNRAPAERLIETLSIPVEVGGGLRSREDVRTILDAGAARAVVGTRAAIEPEWAVELCQSFPDRIVVALDARDDIVTIKGWQECADITVTELASVLSDGPPAAFLYTDVARDGMLTHPNFEGVKKLIQATSVPVIASGGVSSGGDIRRLGECGADAVIIGKALYENRLGLREALDIAGEFGSRLAPMPESEF